MKPEICIGHIMHRRHLPVVHQFTYPTYFLRFAIDDISQLKNRWLSIDSWNLFSFYHRDHGARDGSNLAIWIRQLLNENHIQKANGKIILHTYPRILGYVFNPVSFWFCHDTEGNVRAILCEVNNTFNEHHSYLLAHEDERPIAESDWLACRKQFHVSPFFAVDGSYQFRFRWTGNHCQFQIDHHQHSNKLLSTTLSGNKQVLTAKILMKLFFTHAWMTFAVIARIHLQAWQIWRKGVKFHTKPTPPDKEISR
ncbi:MAG: DUF1365 domain-containing protein [Sulfuriferula sp.]|nr:DUF1365 domain-containing protein [Sulfuriferula sp.]